MIVSRCGIKERDLIFVLPGTTAIRNEKHTRFSRKPNVYFCSVKKTGIVEVIPSRPGVKINKYSKKICLKKKDKNKTKV